MANSNQDPANKPVKKATRELSMEMRLLLAFVLMGLVLFVTPYFMKTVNPPPAKPPAAAQVPKTEEKKTDEPPAVKKAEAKKSEAKKSEDKKPAAVPQQVTAQQQDDAIVVETDLYRVRFSNRGGVVRDWTLKKFLDNNQKPVQIVNGMASSKVGYPFALLFKGTQITPDLNQALYAVKRADALSVEFEFSDGKVQARKSFRFSKSRYLTEVSSEVTDQGRPTPHLLAWRGGFGDFSALNALSTHHTLHFDTSTNKLEITEVKAAKDGPSSSSGRYLFAGLEDMYFAAVALPAPGSTFEIQTWSDNLPPPGQTTGEEPHIGAAIGGESVNRMSMFVGPKDLDILRAVDPRLEQVVDFGWFWFLAHPLFQSVNYVNDKYLHNYGWAIVVVTVIINFLMLPLKFSNIKSMKKMAQLQPEMKEIQARYSGLSMKDPRKQEQQQETMALYKKHGVNPLGGCVPMLLQLPFFIAFYKVLTVTIEMRGASWLWVADLSQPETIAIRVLPLATVASQFLMQKMTPSTTTDPQQQRMMMLMPLMFIFIFYNAASGLVLYWLTGNVVGIAQQWFFNRMGAATPAAAVAKAAPKKKGGK
ncbi:MAG: membrane protein insertase YidC [Candidatus Solibacter usitatus]|nr:membrane protein insertase YidC [Candidatus Solibacter usitatus]